MTEEWWADAWDNGYQQGRAQNPPPSFATDQWAEGYEAGYKDSFHPLAHTVKRPAPDRRNPYRTEQK